MDARPGQDRLVAWFGREYFAGSLPDFGWRLALHAYHTPKLFTWADVLDICGGEAPHVLVLGDRSHPPPFLGLETFPCLTVFYSVDSHIHAWHPLYAQAFDAALVSLQDHLPAFAQGRLDAGRVLWTPAYAPNPEHLPPPGQPAGPSALAAQPAACPGGLPPHDAPGASQAEHAPPCWPVLFVGTVDPVLTPGRHAFLARLGALLPELAVRQGPFTELFPKGRILLNVAERGDLNFRVFEALVMGKCLLTPRTGNGLADLFEDGVDLLTYSPGDAADAAAKARWLLAHPDRAEAMARSGFAKVNALHRAAHRAQAASGFIARLLAAGYALRLAQAATIREGVLRPLHLHWAESCGDAAMSRRYMESLRKR